ncbi:MAG TPA: DUF881 domain-containing protein [Actinomycetota bacterium]|nr:DUF881 domain-containing protein [Actinomycetota bacterium]
MALLGFALVIAGTNADPGPRGARRERLIDLIEREDQRARTLRDELERLQADLKTRSAEAGRRGSRLDELRTQIESLASLAGSEPVVGPGVRVELRDSTLRRSPTGDPNDLVIHEQDLQAVVNALWSGGAEGIAINGERITSFSAVRCVGNTLLLHGSVYAPPYRIVAIGDPAALVEALRRDALTRRFEIFAQEFRLGYDVMQAEELRLPAFRGVLTSRFTST